MKRVAIITARGGSKRLPRKNIRHFHGRPIIHYAIDTLNASGIFDEILVSTDDAEIASVAAAAGLESLVRPDALADDHATTGQVMRHAVQQILGAGERPEHVACIYPCTPLMIPADLHAGLDKLLSSSGKSYVLPIAEYAPSVHRALMRWADDSIRPVWANLMQQRTQDLEKRYYDAGQWYIGRTEAWLAEIPILDSWSVSHLIPRNRAVDIDTIEDWQLAEALYQANVINEGRSQ